MKEGLSQVTHGLWKVKEEEGKGKREKEGELSGVLDSLACKEVSAEPEFIFLTSLKKVRHSVSTRVPSRGVRGRRRRWEEHKSSLASPSS